MWPRRPSGVRRRGALLALLLIGLLTSSARSQPVHSELEVEAAYLYRMAAYVEWPDPVATGRPFVIAVMGYPDLARELKKLETGHLIREHVVQILEVDRAQELENVRILFVGAERNEFLRGLTRTDPPPILIVTAEDRGLEYGAMVNFVTIDDRVRFEISVTAAERAQLKVSADLLAIALRVNGGRRQSATERLYSPGPEGVHRVLCLPPSLQSVRPTLQARLIDRQRGVSLP